MTTLDTTEAIRRALRRLDNSTADGKLLVDALVAFLQVAGPNKLAYDCALEFFTIRIPNQNTRAAYCRAVRDFFSGCLVAEVVNLGEVEAVHVAAYLEQIGKSKSAPTVKQNLAAIRSLFDWLVTGEVVATNPATSVRGPEHSQRKGKTRVLMPDDARKLIESIPIDTIVGLRDRALIAVMIYSFARVSAATSMTGKDVSRRERRLWLRLHEKRGKFHEMPCHHNLEQYLLEYMDAAGFGEDYAGPLFPTIDRKTKTLSNRPLDRTNSLLMVRRRANNADVDANGICNHTLRGTGIAAYLANPDARLERAQRMAAHSDPKTTHMYDRRDDEVSAEEVEKIGI